MSSSDESENLLSSASGSDDGSDSDGSDSDGTESDLGSDSDFEYCCSQGSCSKNGSCSRKGACDKNGSCSRKGACDKNGSCSRNGACNGGSCSRSVSPRYVASKNSACSRKGVCSVKRENALSFDVGALENIILMIFDKFDFRVVMGEERSRNALLVTTGLSLAGGMIGKHYGGNVGMAIGGAVGGACGLGIVAVSMIDIWEDIKYKLSELFDLVYDFLAGLELKDYKQAATFLTSSPSGSQLATVLLGVASDILGKKVLSSLT